MKVYVITAGSYSDYHICAVTLDKKEAENLKEKFSKHSGYIDAEIEEYDTDNNTMFLRHNNFYFCECHKHQISISITMCSFLNEKDFAVRSTPQNDLYVYVNADTEEDALKICSDKFAQYRAEHEML